MPPGCHVLTSHSTTSQWLRVSLPREETGCVRSGGNAESWSTHPSQISVSRHPRQLNPRQAFLEAQRAQSRAGSGAPRRRPWGLSCRLRLADLPAPEHGGSRSAVPRAIQLRVFTGAAAARGSGAPPAATFREHPRLERDFSLSHSRVRSTECWGLASGELAMAEACFEKRAETGWAPNRGWWALPEVPAPVEEASP